MGTFEGSDIDADVPDGRRVSERARRRASLTIAGVAAAVAAVTVGSITLLAAHPATAPVATPGAERVVDRVATQAVEDCPSMDDVTQGAAVDYVDFVHYNDRSYTDPPTPGPPQTSPPELGAEQFRVRCSLSALNERTMRMPPAPRNGDAGFLEPGTPVYAVRGYSPLCRLAAKSADEWHVYLADDPAAATWQPAPCALAASSDPGETVPATAPATTPATAPVTASATPTPPHDGPTPTPAPSSPVTDLPVTVTLWHCGVSDLTIGGMVWVAEKPPFDATNAPASFTGHGVVNTIGPTLVYSDDGGASIEFQHNQGFTRGPCA